MKKMRMLIDVFPKCYFRFTGKKYVFVSTRVHPGEVPGSHVFNGMLQLLLDKNDAR